MNKEMIFVISKFGNKAARVLEARNQKVESIFFDLKLYCKD